MPARKPSVLKSRHDTNEEKAAERAAEELLKPVTQLTLQPPKLLSGHKHATATWKELIGLYQETEGQIVTAFDAWLLAKYCLLEEEAIALEGLRDAVLADYETVSKQLSKMKPKADNYKEYGNLLEQKVALLTRYQGFDARLDGKRKFLVDMAQQLYLTPRSRAGVAPAAKEKKPAKSSMDALLDD